jgi:hypothetical protein
VTDTCADQYYGGSLFNGDVNATEAICLRHGVMGYCGEGALASFTSPGGDEFDVLDPSSGVYWATPPGSMTIGPNGGPAVSTGTLGFSDQLWSEGSNTSDVLEGTLASRSQPNYLNSLQPLYDALTGDYMFMANPGSAAAQSPAPTAFGPVTPLFWMEVIPPTVPGQAQYLVVILGPNYLMPVPGLGQ